MKRLGPALVAVAVAGVLTTSSARSAHTSCGFQPFLGQVCTFAFNFCPRGFLPADGRLLPINQNVALFSLLGVIYGGDGKSTFALPDLRGRTPVGASVLGSSPPPGQTGGDASTVNLRIDNSSGGVPVPATQSPFVGLTRCIAADGVYPPRF